MNKKRIVFGIFGILLSIGLVLSLVFVRFTGEGAIVKITPKGETIVLHNMYLKTGGNFIYYPPESTCNWQTTIGEYSVYSKYTIKYPVKDDQALIQFTNLFGNRQEFEKLAMQGQMNLSTYFIQAGEKDTKKIALSLGKKLSFVEIDISEFGYSKGLQTNPHT